MLDTPGAPEVSVVIPTRNRWHLLSSTLRGALRQEDVEHEVIVVDDASSDETPARLAEIRDPRLRVLRQEENVGVAQARNRGIAEARGASVAFLDDDDVWSPRKLRTQLDVAAEAGASFVYGPGLVLDEHRNVLELEQALEPDEFASRLLVVNPMPGGCSNVLASTQLVRRVGGFDPKLSMLADWDLWLRLSREGRGAVCSEVLVGYVKYPQNMHMQDLGHMVRELRYLAEKHGGARQVGGDAGFDAVGYSRWLALSQRQAGKRLRAARIYLRGALAYRNFGNLLRAVRALLDPRATASARRHPTQQVPEPTWLQLYR